MPRKQKQERHDASTKCYSCGLSLWTEPDENGVRWTVKLKKVQVEGKEKWACQNCL